ncbi:hypothetical protein [Devosia sp.]|uniref:hypothetical protein n=1 Tax=Devosia sp. TaxID=1871048 RepID=UPI003F6E76A9
MGADGIVSADKLENEAQEFIGQQAEEFWKPLPDGELTLFFVQCRSHNFGPLDHLHRLAVAYALLVGHGGNTDVLHAARGKPVRRAEVIDAARIFVEAVTPTDGLSPRKAQQRHSRDTRAIRYLEATRVRPQSVVELGRKKGEGVHVWAGRYAANRSTQRVRKTGNTTLTLPALITLNFEGKERHWLLDSSQKIEQVQKLLSKWPEKKLRLV